MRQAIVTLKKGEGRLLKSGGAWIKEFRASLAVTDAGFAKGIRKHLDMEEG